jgi:hypothetical protein
VKGVNLVDLGQQPRPGAEKELGQEPLDEAE